MADETPNPNAPALTGEQLVAAAKAVAQAPAIITPSATRISQRPLDKFEEAIQNFKPDGNPHPTRIKAVQAALEILKADFPDADNLEARIETSGTGNAHQILVQLIQHKF